MKRLFCLFSTAVTLTAISVTCPASVGTEDLASIINRAKERYAAVNSNLRDLTVVQSTRLIHQKKSTGSADTAEMVLYTKGGRLRLETSLPVSPEERQKGVSRESGKSIIIYDGKSAWLINPLFGKTKIANDDPSLLRAQQTWWDGLSKNALLTGTEVIENRQAYVIENRDKSAAFAKLWVDREKLVPLQIEVVRGTTKIRTMFSDYRNVNNITELPYRIAVFQNDAPVSVSTVKTVQVNTGLPDTLFDAGAAKTAGGEKNTLKGSSRTQ